MDALNLTPDLTGPLRGPWVLVTAELSHFSNLPFYVCVFMRVFSWVCACVGVYACGNQRFMSGISSVCSQPSFLETGSPTESRVY